MNKAEISTTVYAWGFNDKKQLGGVEPNLNLEETKIHYPLISAGANKLNPSQVTFEKISFLKSYIYLFQVILGDRCIFVISNGYVYAAGEGSSGRLGLGSSDSCPTLTRIEGLTSISKVKN